VRDALVTNPANNWRSYDDWCRCDHNHGKQKEAFDFCCDAAAAKRSLWVHFKLNATVAITKVRMTRSSFAKKQGSAR
jgi:hypothetical protein